MDNETKYRAALEQIAALANVTKVCAGDNILMLFVRDNVPQEQIDTDGYFPAPDMLLIGLRHAAKIAEEALGK